MNEEYQQNVSQKLTIKPSVELYYGFVNKSIRIERLGVPIGLTRMEPTAPSALGAPMFNPVLIKRIGIPIIVKTNNMDSIELTVPATDELWDAVKDKGMAFSFQTKKELIFNENGIACDLIIKPFDVNDDPSYRYFDNVKLVDEKDVRASKVTSKFMQNTDGKSFLHKDKDDAVSQIKEVPKDSVLDRLVILEVLTSPKKSVTLKYADPNLDSEVVNALVEAIGNSKKKLVPMQFIDIPKSMIWQINDKTVYIKMLS